MISIAIVSRIRPALAIVAVGLALSACGYNTIPTLEEQAKARWADVQNHTSAAPTSFRTWWRPCKATQRRRRTC